MTEPTYDLTHSDGCWRRHHRCAIERIEALTAALADALSRYDRTWQFEGPDGPEHFTARAVSPAELDAWHRVLELADTDVAGADVTPDPAAPATTT